MDTLKFVTAGQPICNGTAGYKRAFEILEELGLDGMELEFVHGVRMTEANQNLVRDIVKEKNMVITAHGPYYINLNSKEDEKIDFTKTNTEIDNKIRALNPTPGAYTTLNGKRLKVYDVRLSDRYYSDTEPGTIVGFEKDGIRVVTGDKEIILTDIALEGKTRCLVKDYLNGVDKKELLGVVLK